jgi:tRNA A37 threonylcarbamoyladenosine synthetase subunit TsaC/SUA5/YrdC
MLSATLYPAESGVPFADAAEIRRALEHQLDLVIDSGTCGVEPSTVVDLTGEEPVVVREGKGPIGVLGLRV